MFSSLLFIGFCALTPVQCVYEDLDDMAWDILVADHYELAELAAEVAEQLGPSVIAGAAAGSFGAKMFGSIASAGRAAVTGGVTSGIKTYVENFLKEKPWLKRREARDRAGWYFPLSNPRLINP